jgi:hypothetical protein
MTIRRTRNPGTIDEASSFRCSQIEGKLIEGRWNANEGSSFGNEFWILGIIVTSGVVGCRGNGALIREQTSHPGSFRGAKSENTLVSVIEMFVGLNPQGE